MRLDLVIGPNGAGKSTFVELTLAQLVPHANFVNADEIARQRWPEDPQGRAYDAARVAADTRLALIERGEPLIAETVFSHPAKLELVDLAHAAGFLVALHVLLVPEELAVARVRARVAAGGHDVPADKIRGRYARLWPLVRQAIGRADTAVCYDNSTRAGPREIARFAAGDPVGAPDWPGWTPADLR